MQRKGIKLVYGIPVYWYIFGKGFCANFALLNRFTVFYA